MQAAHALLEMTGVSKRFPGVVALGGVDFSVRAGEVHALVGENGAGKSTLMKIIGGIYTPSDGEMRVDGQIVHFPSPSTSRAAGIAMVHQEPKLCGNLSVTENVLMGDLPRSGLGISWKKAHARTAELLRQVGLSVDPTEWVEALSIAERQLLQIAHALAKPTRLIILDEPTASLTPYEIDVLFGVVRELKATGVSFIYISHHLEEIFRIADRVTVFKDGAKVAERATSETHKDELVSLMVGRDLGERFPAKRDGAADVVLEVRNLSGPGFRDVSFSLRRGEVLGIAGLVGAGRTELARALCGAATVSSGEIRVGGEPVRFRNPGDAIARGIAYVAEDRRDGLFMPLTVGTNITIAAPDKVSRHGVFKRSMQDDLAGEYARRLQIRTPSLDQKIQFLSGGNQQKCILARWLIRGVEILIVDEPTRGIDVGAKSEIYKLVDDYTRARNAVILISSEMTEVIGMADRLVVMCEGRLTGEIQSHEATEESVLALALPRS
jgi:ABC-type sugar transport system ATPase subunit